MSTQFFFIFAIILHSAQKHLRVLPIARLTRCSPLPHPFPFQDQPLLILVVGPCGGVAGCSGFYLILAALARL